MNKTIAYLYANWLIILITVLFCQIFPWLYLIGFFLIASRQFAIYLVGHEGLHGLITKNSFFNDYITKYFCLFPVLVSLEMYRTNHLAHHRFLGTAVDPDRNLYNFYPVKKETFFKSLFQSYFNLKLLKDFLRYFTPFYLLKKMGGAKALKKGDFLEYFIYLTLTLLFLAVTGLWFIYLKYWLAPLLLMIPYYYFVSALQHGLIHENAEGQNSRNIKGSGLAMEFLLPCKTNFHGTHHDYPGVACWELAKVAEKQNTPAESYSEAVAKLLT